MATQTLCRALFAFLATAMIVCMLASVAVAQQPSGTKGSNAPPAEETESAASSSAVGVPGNGAPPDEVEAPHGPEGYLTKFERQLSLQILIFGVIVLALEYMALRHEKTTAEETLRMYAVTLIIIGTLFAIAAGFDSNQIAPAMGLFGTIAGYLLGRRSATPSPTVEGETK